jgi:riboflavin kinase/FMN adenylyltransferase
MEIIRDLEALPRHPYPVTAIGNFDGVHLGHRAILKAAIDRARAAGGTAFALTFDPLPAKLLVPARAPRLILTADDKLELLRLSGIDGVIVIKFTLDLSMLSPHDFVRDYMSAKIGVREVVVGQNFRFGHNRAGTAAVMVELGRQLGFDTDVVGPVKVGGIEISSTKVREAIAAADLRGAARLLGRYHFLHGPVVR